MSKILFGHSTLHYRDRTDSSPFLFSFTDLIPGTKEAITPRRLGLSNNLPVPCGLLPGVFQLDHALGHKLHTTMGKLRAMSAYDLRFPWMLDLTGCSDVVVLELRHHRWIRRH